MFSLKIKDSRTSLPILLDRPGIMDILVFKALQNELIVFYCMNIQSTGLWVSHPPLFTLRSLIISPFCYIGRKYIKIGLHHSNLINFGLKRRATQNWSNLSEK